jgi:hypothetical protein
LFHFGVDPQAELSIWDVMGDGAIRQDDRETGLKDFNPKYELAKLFVLKVYNWISYSVYPKPRKLQFCCYGAFWITE